MRVRRALQGATIAAVLAALMPVMAASAATTATIVSIESNAGPFSTSPAAGRSNNPKVTVNGVIAGDTVTLTWNGAENNPTGVTCVVAPTFTSVTFNTLTDSHCAVPATAQFTLSSTGVYSFFVTDPAGTNLTPFDYNRDLTIPLAPAAPVNVAQKIAASLEVSFGRSPAPGDPGSSPSGVAKYEVLRNDITDGSGYTTIATFSESVCGATICTYLDSSSDGQPIDGHQYNYAARAIDAAGNTSGSGENPNPTSATVTADGSGPTAPDAPTVTPTSPNADVGFGNDSTPVISVTNPSSETVTISLVANSSPLGSSQTAAPSATVTWNDGGPVATLPSNAAYSIQASSADSLGNPSISPGTSYTLDTVAPAAPSITSINDQTGSSTAGSDTSPKVVIGGIVNQDRVVLTANDNDTSSSGAGTFTLRSTGTTVTYNPTAAEDFTITGGDRTVTFSATTTDRAGNVSPGSSTPKTYALDNTAPSAPSITSISADTTTPGSGYDRTPRIVVAWAATTSTVEIYDGATLVGQKTVGATSPVVFNDTAADSDVTLTYGSHSLTARAKDQADNPSNSAAFVFDELDNRSPDVPAGLTATKISGSPSRVFLDWANASDQADGSGNSSGPPTYTVARAQANPVDSTCPSGAALTYAVLTAGLTSSTYTDAATTAGQCLYYEVRSVDGASNTSAYTAPTSGLLIAANQSPATPVISSVNGDSTSPATGSGTASAKPSIAVTLGEAGGTVKIYVDGTQMASKAVTSTSVSISSADWTSSVPVRRHVLTAAHTVGSTTSAVSGEFVYGRSPDAPTITSVAGKSASPAKSTDKKPPVNVSGVRANDIVSLFSDGTKVASRTATGTSVSFIRTDYSANLTLGSHSFTVKTCDPAIGSCASVPDATSAASATFVYQLSPVVSGYELDGFGGLHAFGGAPSVTDGPYWSGWDIARAMVLRSNGTSGYVLDGFGGIHPFGGAPDVVGAAYFGFDIARDMVLITDTSGYVLDGWGGIHSFGGAPALTGGPYFQGFDIARAFVVSAPGKGYVLDGWGGIHSVGGAPAIASGAYWNGWDIARGIVLRANATSGYVLDGLGGTHAFGGAPAASSSFYSPDNPRARSLILTEGNGAGGYVLEARGGLYLFGTAPTLTRPATFSFDIARDVAVKLS